MGGQRKSSKSGLTATKMFREASIQQVATFPYVEASTSIIFYQLVPGTESNEWDSRVAGLQLYGFEPQK